MGEWVDATTASSLGARDASTASAPSLVALAIVRGGRLLLVAPGVNRWRRELGYTLSPLELPGGWAREGADLDEVAAEVGSRFLRGPIRLRSSRWVYSPSDRHVVDRRAPAADERPAPLALLSRMSPEGEGYPPDRLHRVTVRILRAECVDEPAPGGESMGIFELPFAAARAAVRGLPAGDLLAMDGVRAEFAGDAEVPDDTVFFLPSEYGERYLLRVVAKYGERALAVSDEEDRDGRPAPGRDAPLSPG